MTIEEIKQLVNQRIIENYTGDITAEDVNRIMNETLDHLGESEGKVSELVQKVEQIEEEKASVEISDSNDRKVEVKVNALIDAVAHLIKNVVYTGGTPYQVPEELLSSLKLSSHQGNSFAYGLSLPIILN